MRPIYWLFIIAAVLLLAVGVYLLTRKPSTPKEEGHEVSEYGPGGQHVAAGDAGVEAASPATQTLEPGRTPDSPYDQEADQDDPAQSTSEDGHDATSEPDAGYINTATGQEVPLEDESSEEEQPGEEQEEESATSREEAANPDREASPAMQDDWVPVEPYPEQQHEEQPHELPSADQPRQRADHETQERAEHEKEEREAAAAVTYGSPSDLGEDKVYAVPDHGTHGADNDASDADNDGPEPRHRGGSTAYPSAEQTGQDAPGADSEPDQAVIVTPDAGDADIAHPSDEDRRHDDEQPAEEQDEHTAVPQAEPVETDETAQPVETDETAQPVETDETVEPQAPTEPAWEEHDDDVPPDAAAAGFEPAPSPYGPGTALPAQDGSGPEDWDIKGNAGSMLFHTPDSPSYAESRAEVWFESEQAARAAGFAHWDRKRR